MNTYHAGKNARVFFKKTASGTAVELPINSFSVDPGAAKRIEFAHSMSQGGTDVDLGMKSAPTFQITQELDFDNDPFSTTGLKLVGGEVFAEIAFYPYGGIANTPTGICHKFVNALIEGTPLDVMIDGKPGIRTSGCCSTRNYSYSVAA